MIRPIARGQLLLDLLIGVLVVLPLAFFDIFFVGGGSTGNAIWWAVVLTPLMIGLLTIRRLAPVPALLGALLISCVHVLVLGEHVYALWFAVLLLLATVGRFAKQSYEWWITVGIILVAALLVSASFVRILFGIGSTGISEVIAAAIFGFIPSALLFGGAVLAGVVLRLIVRTNREAAERQRAEASMLAQMQLRAEEEERTAIARDMHDVVAHSLAVVVAQANGARYTADVERKDATLATIADTAKSALTDVRGLLHQLRHSQAADASTGLCDVPELVERMRMAGLQVLLSMPASEVRAARTTQLAAYRIVQESLTNAMRHGNVEQPVHVRLVTEAGRLLVDVHNRPRSYGGAPRDLGGHGLTGMRERAVLAGGSAWIGLDEGWFRVRAEMPLEVQH